MPPDGTADVIVIGAGFGGLAAAMLLAARGLAVTIVDARDTPGGKARNLPSVAGPVAAGPTVMTMRPVFEALFADTGASLGDHVALNRQPVLARHWWPDGGRLDLFDDETASADAVAALSGPEDAAAFRAFSAEARALFAAFDAPMMRAADPQYVALARAALRQPALWPALRPGLSLAAALRRRFRDKRLAQLFGRYATYVGGMPDAVPALLALIWQAEAGGVWTVSGGLQQLAQAMAARATDCGADLHLGAQVRSIRLQEGRASGVEMADGSSLQARRILFNGDPAALRGGLLGAGLRHAVRPGAVAPRSLSAWVWSFAARAEGPPLAHHNLFFAARADSEFPEIAAGIMPRDPTLYVCAQDRGAGRTTPAGPERFQIIMNAPPLVPDAGDAAGGADPNEEYQKCRNRVFGTLARHGLHFDPRPGPMALTRPADFAALFPGSDGSLYGRSPHGLTASLRRPRAQSRIPGLYLAGGGTHPGAGVPMAALSGRHAAAAILSDLASTSPSRPTAMPGGMWTASAMTESARSR